jgi:hypothetical protein
MSCGTYGFAVEEILSLEIAVIFKFHPLTVRKFARWKCITRLKGLISALKHKFF